MLTAKEIIDQGILIPNGMGKPAQVGYDVTVKNIREITGGAIGVDGNIIKDYRDLNTQFVNETWMLRQGVYSLTFDQGVKLDSCHSGVFRHRSSMLRVGCIVTSGIFDPGFECKEAGATLIVLTPTVKIEKGARVAQFLVMENNPAELYDGNYQGEKDVK